MIHRHLEGEACNASCTPAPVSFRGSCFSAPINRVVSYPRNRWSRSDAWRNLLAQKIPGAPQRPINEATGHWTHGWTKSHTADEWRWIYWHPEGCKHAEHWKDCEHCSQKDRS